MPSSVFFLSGEGRSAAGGGRLRSNSSYGSKKMLPQPKLSGI